MPNQTKSEEHKMSKQAEARKKVLAALDALDQEVDGAKSAANGKESFSKLFEESVEASTFSQGDVVPATVIETQSDYVLVDINYKSEGLIPINEFRIVDGVRQVKAGDKVEVLIDRIENENGMIALSKDKADMLRAWSDISKAAENEEIIEGLVVAKV